MYIYKTLESTRIESLLESFVSAFSDYEVRIDMPLWKFKGMMQRRGFVPEASIGAFVDDRLVGFILNAVRAWNGVPTAYDVGTGVVEEHRKRGITSQLLSRCRVLLGERRVEQYLLEVLQLNSPALELYSKQGFATTRSFSCFVADKDRLDLPQAHRVEHLPAVGPAERAQFSGFWDSQPSWQNSWDSVRAAAEAFLYSVVMIDRSVVGYGILDKRTGDIAQLAVKREFRRKGVGRSILADLVGHSESTTVAMLNVDDGNGPLKEFLQKAGFELSVAQYEMRMKL